MVDYGAILLKHSILLYNLNNRKAAKIVFSIQAAWIPL